MLVDRERELDELSALLSAPAAGPAATLAAPAGAGVLGAGREDRGMAGGVSR